MPEWWNTFGPHRAVGQWRIRGDMWQVVGGRYWSLVLFRNLRTEDEGEKSMTEKAPNDGP